MIQVTRSISFYEKYGENYIGEFDISEIRLGRLKKIVEMRDDDPYLYECYLLSKEQLDKLNALTKHSFDYKLNEHDYFLECTAVAGYYENHRIRGGRKGGYPAPRLGKP